MTTVILLFIVGLVLIILGGDKFVDAAVEIAYALKVPEIIVGATIVSIGTTLPEVLVSTSAAISGSADIAAGNAFGSIICNTSLIAALTQLLRPTPNIERKSIARECVIFFATAVLVLVYGIMFGKFGRLLGVMLLIIFAVYAIVSISDNAPKAGGETEEEGEEKKPGNIGKNVLILFVTAAVLFVGSKLLVNNGIILAEYIGVPERVIGVTFIALGTSLPELVTAMTSIIKGHGQVSVGNILGANFLNLTLVIGIPSTICGINPSQSAIYQDLPIGIGVMLLLTVPMLSFRKGSRVQGIVLLGIYAAYCVTQFIA